MILRDVVGIGHPVLNAPPLAVSKDEIERRVTYVTPVL